MHISKLEKYMMVTIIVCTSILTALIAVPIGITKGKEMAIKENKLAAINNELDLNNNHKNNIEVIEETLEGDNAELKIHINKLGDVNISFDITDIAGTLTANSIESCEPTASYGSELQEKNYQAILRRKQLEEAKQKEQEQHNTQGKDS